MYVRDVWTGFTDAARRHLRAVLLPLHRDSPPFYGEFVRARAGPVARPTGRSCIGSSPRLVGEIEYGVPRATSGIPRGVGCVRTTGSASARWGRRFCRSVTMILLRAKISVRVDRAAEGDAVEDGGAVSPEAAGTQRVGVWFERMAHIPGLGFRGSPGIDRARLPGVGLTPSSQTTFGMLMWSGLTSGQRTSRSPAMEHIPADPAGLELAELLRVTWESLELPGEPIAYHFALQTAVGALWERRGREPEGLTALETFALWDLRLIEVEPAAGSVIRADEGLALHLSSADLLIRLFEREGALREALDIARRVERLGNGQADKAVARLSTRIATSDAAP